MCKKNIIHEYNCMYVYITYHIYQEVLSSRSNCIMSKLINYIYNVNVIYIYTVHTVSHTLTINSLTLDQFTMLFLFLEYICH